MKRLQWIGPSGWGAGGGLRPIHHWGHTEAPGDVLDGDWNIGYLSGEAKERSKVYQKGGRGLLVRIVGRGGGLSCWCLYNAGVSGRVSCYVLR